MWISCIPYHSICNVLFDLRVSKWACDSCAYYLLVRIWKLAMCFSVKKYLCSLKLTQIASFISTHILLPFRSDSLFYLEKWQEVHIIESTTGDIVKYIVREIICICIDILNCKWHPKKRQKPKSHERNCTCFSFTFKFFSSHSSVCRLYMFRNQLQKHHRNKWREKFKKQ